MKKFLAIVLTVVTLLSVAVFPSMASENITVVVDGKALAFDVPPQMINNRTMVPLRAIFEALGATVSWDDATQRVTAKKGETTISLQIGNQFMSVGSKFVQLDSVPIETGGRTLVPVRAISESLNAEVVWVEATNTVVITTKKETSVLEVTVPEVSVPVEKWYEKGMYRVGYDLPAGDYYAVATSTYGGYYCKYEDSTQDDIEDNDNFDTFTFFRCYNGQYLKLSRCKITDIKNAPVYKAQNGVYGEGMYRVGIDIPAGEYKFIATSAEYGGYYCAYTDITYKNIEDNDFFDGNTYYTIKDGQYLKINRATAQLVSSKPTTNNNTVGSNSKYYSGTTIPTYESIVFGTTLKKVLTVTDNTHIYEYKFTTTKDVSTYCDTLVKKGWSLNSVDSTNEMYVKYFKKGINRVGVYIHWDSSEVHVLVSMLE